MLRRTTLALLPAALLLAGCPHEKYTLELRPNGSRMERTLAVQGVEKTRVSSERLDAIARLYGLDRQPPDGNGPIVFRGTFDGNMPDDVGGGFGRFLTYPTGAGALNVYAESFRGDDDPYAQVKAQRQAVELAVSLARGWLEQEVGGEEGFEKLDRFLRTQAADDLTSLSLYAWQIDNAGTWALSMHPDVDRLLVGAVVGEANAPKALQDALARDHDANTSDSGPHHSNAAAEIGNQRLAATITRACLMLAHKGYVSAGNVPAWAGLIGKAVEDPAVLKTPLRALLVGKVGLKDHPRLVQRLTGLLLDDPNRAEESFERYFRTTDLYAQAARQLGHDADEDEVRKAAELKLQQRLYPMLHGLYADVITATSDELFVTLHTGAKPLETNGQWCDANGVVRWAGAIQGIPSDGNVSFCTLPSVCYAVWARPDEGQVKQFGRAVLDANALPAYTLAVWRLSPADRQQWEKLYAQLTGENCRSRLEALADEKPELWQRLRPVAEILEKAIRPAD